jgi:hypothetical protein
MPFNGVRTVHEHFRFDDWHEIAFLAECRVTRQCLRVRLDARAGWNSPPNRDDCAPLRKPRTKRSRNPSSPSVIFSPGKFAIAFAPLSTLIPGTIPCCSSTSTKLRPSWVFCRIVSSKRITPLINSPAPFVVNKSSRYARRFSSVEGTLMLFSRFSIVPELSSAARIPFPGATSFFAMDSRFSVFIIVFFFVERNSSLLPRKILLEMQTKTNPSEDLVILF